MEVKVTDEAHRCVGNEVKYQNFDPMCLSKALMESRGDHELAMSLYVKKRLKMISDEFLVKEQRDKDFTNRKLQAVAPYSEPEPHQIPAPTACHWVTICIYHIAVTFSFFGAIWTANIIFGKKKYVPHELEILIGMVVVNVLPIIVYCWIRLYLRNLSYQTVVFYYAVLCGLTSFALGVNLLK